MVWEAHGKGRVGPGRVLTQIRQEEDRWSYSHEAISSETLLFDGLVLLRGHPCLWVLQTLAPRVVRFQKSFTVAYSYRLRFFVLYPRTQVIERGQCARSSIEKLVGARLLATLHHNFERTDMVVKADSHIRGDKSSHVDHARGE